MRRGEKQFLNIAEEKTRCRSPLKGKGAKINFSSSDKREGGERKKKTPSLALGGAYLGSGEEGDRGSAKNRDSINWRQKGSTRKAKGENVAKANRKK